MLKETNTKITTDVNAMSEILQITEILAEANAYSLKAEVIASAECYIKDDPNLDKILAYEMAYIEWISNFES
jgi:hypothetical protein